MKIETDTAGTSTQLTSVVVGASLVAFAESTALGASFRSKHV